MITGRGRVCAGLQMNLKAAYELLGLAPGCDQRQARRAYLRLLRTHKPERDPEGFMRLRQAYEQVKAAAEIGPFRIVDQDGNSVTVLLAREESEPKSDDAGAGGVVEPQTDRPLERSRGARYFSARPNRPRGARHFSRIVR